MRKRSQVHWMTVLMVSLLVACGAERGAKLDVTSSDKNPVRAMNLDTGETKTFSSSSDLPPGWAPCSDSSCDDGAPTDVPCQNLGTDVCEANPDCRLFELSCTGTGVACPEGATCPDAPTEPPVCEYACIPKLPLLCSELQDEKDCASRDDCEWVELGMGCLDCGPAFMCQQKAPPPCEELAENQCAARSDCQWSPQPCPLCEPADGKTCACPAFCQPVNQDPPGCPTVVSPPTDFCPDGVTQPVYDSNNCVVDFECLLPTDPATD